MRVLSLSINPAIYSSKAYLVLGDWSCLDDVNTLIDTGNDPAIMKEIESIYTGVGKRAVEQIILTHSHFDHKGTLKLLIERYKPVVYAFSPFAENVRKLKDGQIMRIGDRFGEVIHIPGHSADSICFHCPEEKALFSGDTPLRVRSSGGTYLASYLEGLKRISRLPLEIIYPGHDEPITRGIEDMMLETLAQVRNSVIVENEEKG